MAREYHGSRKAKRIFFLSNNASEKKPNMVVQLCTDSSRCGLDALAEPLF